MVKKLKNKIYFVYDYWHPDEYMYAFPTLADAEEHILAVAYDNDYATFCAKGKDNYFKQMTFYKDFKMGEECKSNHAHGLWLGAYGLEIQEVSISFIPSPTLYVFYNRLWPTSGMYAFPTMEDAMEFLLSITEENLYEAFCSAETKEKFFKDFQAGYEDADVEDDMSLAGYMLYQCGYDYNITKTILEV